MLICFFLISSLNSKVFRLFKNVIQGLKTKLIALKQVIKKNSKIFLLCGPHLHARGREIFFCGPPLARGPQFGEPFVR